jgi:hypothetical protein
MKKKYYNSIEKAVKALEKEVKQGLHPNLKRLKKWQRK